MIIQTPIAQLVINWFHFHGRKNLPWKKKNNNIYHIWISEIMLQQTQVNTVIPFYKKFIIRFPSIQTIQQTSLDEVLYYWSGLGYYRRAVSIYNTAQIIYYKYNNLFPETIEKLIKLPGIGKTTAGAILSFSKNFCFAILDINIKRILVRYYYLINANTSKKFENFLWKIINSILPLHQASYFNQGIMDLGATICTPIKPKCNICPLKNHCLYCKKDIYKQDSYLLLKKKKIRIIQKKFWCCIIQYQNYILIEKQINTTIWKNLFCFPLFKKYNDLNKWISNNNIIVNKKIQFINTIQCKYTHFNVKILPIIYISNNICKTKKNFIWFNYKYPIKLGFPVFISKIIKIIQLKEKNNE
ncbi:Adenine DNA glycosylase [Buchnera aphidicola (Thelaxes suberi)]|uniref:A/G-specific adenine glycosylase n=1 Tax=Buchnera aphidicola TaxID=9 RepID=UPI0034645FFE